MTVKDFIMVCTGAVLAVIIVTYLAMFFNIWLPNARNESTTEKLYNRCLAQTSYKNTADCKYILEVKK